MEYIDGEALDRVLARRGKMSWEEVASFGKQLCEALQYAHDKGIIHRDLKPSNLMLTREGVLKLTDFGIAKDTDVTALTNANSTIGTAAYMSPEQCRGDKNLSAKSDLYSLGVVFFELLSGRKPFTAETTVEMFLKHVNERPPRIGKLVGELPPRFEALILQLLEKRTNDRPIDAAWVGRMLLEVEEDAFARKSVGLAVAEARTLKPRNSSGDRLDASDKDAARALRGRKKKRKATGPLLQQKWVQAAGLVGLLGAMVFGVYLAVKPPAPEKLYASIGRAETPEARLEAASRFLEVHGAKGGELVDGAAGVFREATVRAREKQLDNRFHGNMAKPTEKDDPEAYGTAWEAMSAEKAGTLDAAEALWTKVRGRFPDEAKLQYTTNEDELARARWGWVADKRIADIAGARAELSRIDQKIAASRPIEQPLKTDPTSPESLALRARRLARLGDGDRAARVCEAITTLVDRDPDKHVWYLVGAQIRGTLPKSSGDPVRERLLLLDNWLKPLEKQAAELKTDRERGADRREVRNKCRDVIELYDDDDNPEVQQAVKYAARIAAEIPKS
jgi:serine/threonine-protein kinase